MVDEFDGDAATNSPPSVPRGRAALKVHATLVVGLSLAIGAFIFEINRAVSGNGLSWAYVFEWPVLAVFGVWMWWRILHPENDRSRVRTRHQRSGVAPEHESMLVAWQQHQAELAASDTEDSNGLPGSTVGGSET